MKNWLELKMLDNNEENHISIKTSEERDRCNIRVEENGGDGVVSMYFDEEELDLLISNLTYFRQQMGKIND